MDSSNYTERPEWVTDYRDVEPYSRGSPAYGCRTDAATAPASVRTRDNIERMADESTPQAPGQHMVQCVKLQKLLPGLDAPPWPGELGKRIYDNVSAQAWKMWEERQKMILNEYRLLPWQKEAQELIARQLEDFFFGESAALPPGYVPQGG